MDSNPSFDEFAASARAAGFEEVVERTWAPGTEVATHTHPFAVRALVVHGDFWLTAAGATRHLRPGDRFELAFEEPHAERYGSDGATFWAARRASRGP
jgi:quercetin dioxygenase-like cupin family protein